jgi:hypothetical protein
MDSAENSSSIAFQLKKIKLNPWMNENFLPVGGAGEGKDNHLILLAHPWTSPDGRGNKGLFVQPLTHLIFGESRIKYGF